MRQSTLATLISLSLFGGAASALEPLDYVPADTPYVIANIDRMPTGLTEKMLKAYPAGLYAQVLDGMLTADAARAAQANAEADEEPAAEAESETETDGEEAESDDPSTTQEPMSPAARRVVKALADEFRGASSLLDVMRNLGTRPDAKYAIYGVGAIPVFRWELGDAGKFKAFVGRMEQAYGEEVRKEEGNNGTLWFFGDEKMSIVLGTEGDQLFATLLPTKADAKYRAMMLSPSARPLGERGLAAFNRSQGYTNHGGGYIDIVKLATIFTGKIGPAERAMFGALGEEAPSATPECQADFTSMARNFPRLTMGTTKVSNNGFDFASTLQMESVMAKELAAISTGSASAGASMFTFGMALDPMKAVDFLKAQSDKVQAKPYVCPDLLDLNNSFAEMRTSLNTAPTAMLAGFKGFSVALHELSMDPATKEPKSATATIALTSDAPMMLLGLAQASLPQLAGLSIQPDGKPVALADETLPELAKPAAIAMGEKFLAVANGKDANARLAKIASTKLAARGPVMSMHITGGFYGLMADFMGMAPTSGDPAEKALVDSAASIYRDFQKTLRSIEMSMDVNDKGVEIRQSMLFN